MKNFVLVKSRTVTECSVPVVFQTIKKEYPDGTHDIRELSRSYVFENYEARMPFQMAEKLVQHRPGEYYIEGPIGEVDDEILEKIKKLQEKARGFINPLSGVKSKSKAGIISHIRSNNPEEWKEAGEDLDKYMELYS